jgi:glycosyltransferase involved in cell wall biosynthesis
MINEKILTIITVVYNGNNVIENTIKSVLINKTSECEYIIIDGGSTDGTIKIIEKFEDKIDYFISEKDHGVYDAMNKGIKAAKGKWIYFLNAGDYFYNNTIIPQLIDYFKINRHFDVFIGKVNLVDKSNKIINKIPHTILLPITYRELFYTKLCHQALFIKRVAYIKCGLFCLRYNIFSDFYSVALILKDSNFSFHQNDWIIANYDSGGISGRWQNVVQIVKERELILKEFGEGVNMLIYRMLLIKSYIYYYRKKIRNAFTN